MTQPIGARLEANPATAAAAADVVARMLCDSYKGISHESLSFSLSHGVIEWGCSKGSLKIIVYITL